MQSVHKEKQIHAVVKLRDQELFFSREMKYSLSTISAGKDHISYPYCKIQGMLLAHGK